MGRSILLGLGEAAPVPAASGNLFGFSDAVWLAIIGVVAVVVKDLLDERRARRATEAAKEAAAGTQTALVGIGEIKASADGLAKRLADTAEAKGMAEGRVREKEQADHVAAVALAAAAEARDKVTTDLLPAVVAAAVAESKKADQPPPPPPLILPGSP